MAENRDALRDLSQMQARISDLINDEVVVSRVEFSKASKQQLLARIGIKDPSILFLVFYRDKLDGREPKFVTDAFFSERHTGCDYLTPVFFIDDPKFPVDQARIYKAKRRDAKFPFVDLMKGKSPIYDTYTPMPMDIARMEPMQIRPVQIQCIKTPII